MSGDPRELVILFSRGVAQRRMYSAEHPKVADCRRDFMQALSRFLATTGGQNFFIGVDRGRLIYRGRYLMTASIVGSKLIDLAERLCCGGFTFTASTSEEELGRLMDLAAELDEPVANAAEGRALLDAHGVRTVELAAEYMEVDQFDPSNNEIWEGEEREEDLAYVEMSRALFDAVGQAHDRARRGQGLDLDGARTAAEGLATVSSDNCRDLLQLVHYPDYDTYTIGHSVRMSVLSVMTARTLGFDQDELTEMGAAGLLHDVGKGRIPEQVLFKPNQLDAEERRIMETHAFLGAEILMEQRDATPMMIGAAWGHHRHHGGGGYPAVPFRPVRTWFTGLLQVCDVFEALTAVRPYKSAFTPRRAYEIMTKNIDAFDPNALRAFVRAAGLYPPGCRVRLSDGTKGTVITAGEDIARPRLHRTHGPDGHVGELVMDLTDERHAELEVIGICDD